MNNVVTFGEIMLRLAPSGRARFSQAFPGTVGATFAGAEANAAVTIARMGGDVSFVTALPEGPIADACVADLRKHGVDTRFIVRTAAGRLGVFFYESGSGARPGEVIYDRCHSAVSRAGSEEYDWHNALNKADWLLVSGITPAISDTAAKTTRDAMMKARDLGVKVALDINYRSRLWQWREGVAAESLAAEVLSELATHCHLVVSGVDDAVRFLGCPAVDSMEEVTTDLCTRYENLELIASSVRAERKGRLYYGGFLFDCATRQPTRSPTNGGYEIREVVDRPGIGDAFIGAMLLELGRSGNHQRAIDVAAAAGALAHGIEGDYGLVRAGEVEALITNGQRADGTGGGRVLR